MRPNRAVVQSVAAGLSVIGAVTTIAQIAGAEVNLANIMFFLGMTVFAMYISVFIVGLIGVGVGAVLGEDRIERLLESPSGIAFAGLFYAGVVVFMLFVGFDTVNPEDFDTFGRAFGGLMGLAGVVGAVALYRYLLPDAPPVAATPAPAAPAAGAQTPAPAPQPGGADSGMITLESERKRTCDSCGHVNPRRLHVAPGGTVRCVACGQPLL